SVDRRARDAGHRIPLPAVEVRRAPASRRGERVSDAGVGAPDGAGAPTGWDDAAVRSPGGHVLQSAAWAKIREAQGWRAEFHQLRAAGFRRAPDIQPVIATLELDLGPEEDALFAALEKDTRWSVRHAEKRGVSVRDASGDDDLRALYDLYVETGQRAGFITRT